MYKLIDGRADDHLRPTLLGPLEGVDLIKVHTVLFKQLYYKC